MLIPRRSLTATKKYPLLVLLHGGPQTMWSNAWGYRWNAAGFLRCGLRTLMITDAARQVTDKSLQMKSRMTGAEERTLT